MVSNGPTPAPAMSMEPESNASLTAAPPGQLSPVDLDVDAFPACRIFRSRFWSAHHIEQQVDDAELFGDANLAFGLGHCWSDQAARQQTDTQSEQWRPIVQMECSWTWSCSESERRVALDGGAEQLAAQMAWATGGQVDQRTVVQNTRS